MAHAVASRLPPGLISWLGSLQYRVPLLGPPIRWLGGRATRGVCKVQHGLAKGLIIDNTLGLPGYAMGTSGPDEQAALANLLGPGDVFWNVGANIGFYAILGGRLVGSTGRVVAFEPTPEIAGAARRNAELNAMRHIEVVARAVSDTCGQIEFFITEESVTNSIRADWPVGGRRVLVEATTLDEHARGDGRPPTLISIDVEGAELRVLNGALDVIRRCRPTILLENHWLQSEVDAFFGEHIQPLGYERLELDFVPYRTKPGPVREHTIFRSRRAEA